MLTTTIDFQMWLFSLISSSQMKKQLETLVLVLFSCLPVPSDPERGEFSLGRFAVGGPTTSRRLSAILVSKFYELVMNRKKNSKMNPTWRRPVLSNSQMFLKLYVNEQFRSFFLERQTRWNAALSKKKKKKDSKERQQRHASPSKITPW